MTPNNRSAFWMLEEHLQNAEAQCLAAVSAMRARVSVHQDELSPAYYKLAEGEQQLAKLFAQFLHNAPLGLLDSQVQFAPDEREFSTRAASAGVAEELMKMIHTLTSNLKQLCEMLTLEQTTGLLEDLLKNSVAIARQVSMTRVTMRDGGA